MSRSSNNEKFSKCPPNLAAISFSAQVSAMRSVLGCSEHVCPYERMNNPSVLRACVSEKEPEVQPVPALLGKTIRFGRAIKLCSTLSSSVNISTVSGSDSHRFTFWSIIF